MLNPDGDLENKKIRLLDPSADIADLQAQLQKQEATFRMQVLNVGICQSDPDTVENYIELTANNNAKDWPHIKVEAVDAADAGDRAKWVKKFTGFAKDNYIFDYAFVIINDKEQLVLLMRPGVAPTAPDFPNSPRLPAPNPNTDTDGLHKVRASTFADEGDVKAFTDCMAQPGATEQACFKKGDNGIGFCGEDCTNVNKAICALPFEDWMEKWGGKTAANMKPVNVTINGIRVTCFMGDTMPHRKNITNKAGIDLAPGALKAFGLNPNNMYEATWTWA